MPTAPDTATTGWQRWLPGLQMLRGYRAEWLRRDAAAGLVLTTMLVPVGIAYAEASGVPGIYGLYATIAALLAYALFGPSRILVLGPDSSLAALILAVVLPLSGGDPKRAVTVAAAMALAVGLICIGAGLAKLGFVTELLSKPIRYGYMNGIAIVVLIDQLPKLAGFAARGATPPEAAIDFFRGLLQGRAHLPTLAIGAADVDVARLIGVPVNTPVAEVRRVCVDTSGIVIYLAEITYRGDYVHLEMDLAP